MGLGKTYSTKYLADSNNNTGAAGQVLISTSTGINWSDGTDIIGGPYLPLAAGSGYPLTGDLLLRGTYNPYTQANRGNITLNGSNTNIIAFTNNTVGKGYIYHNGTDLEILNAGTGVLKFAAGDAEKVRITPSGNVGIGTTSPNNILELYKTVDSAIGPVLQLTNSQYTNADNSGSSIQFRGYTIWGPGSSNPRYSEINAINGSGSVPKRIEFKFYADTDVKTPLSILQTGNVGIGTTDPGATLDVNGTGYYSNQLTVDGFDNNAGISFRNGFTPTNVGIRAKAITTANRDGLEILGYNGIDFTINNGDTVAVRINGQGNTGYAGNVGIGTTSPNEKLDVRGKIYIESQGVDWNETTPGLVRGALHFDPVGDGANNTGNAITFGASDSSSGTNANAGIYTRSDGTYGTKMYFATTDSYALGSKARMMIDYNGNVGIGTTSPTANLDVGDGVYNAARRIIVANNSNAGTLANISYDTVLIQQNDAPTLRLFESGENLSTTLSSDNGVSRLASSGNLAFHANGTYTSPGWSGLGGNETMRITNNLVGIGTTVPGTKLHVSSSENANWTTTFQNTLNSNSHTVYTAYNNWSTNARYGVYISGTGTTSADYHLLVNDQFAVVGSGNVGIGTTTPWDLGTGYTGLTIDDTTTGFLAIRSSGTSQVVLSANGNSYLNGGNVGIGTTSPAVRLTLSEVTNNTSLGFYNTGTNAANRNWVIGSNDQVFGDFAIMTSTAIGGSPISAGVKRLYINPSGNVGIGTTNPGYKLDVNGNIRGTGTSQLGHLNCISTLSFGAFTAGTKGTIFEGYSTHSVVRTDSARLDFYMGKTTTGVGTMMSLTDTGRVGIGTTSPSAKLHVSDGDIKLDDTYKILWDNNGKITAGEDLVLGAGGTASTILLDGSDNAMYFRLGSIAVISIRDDYNVGIGTTSPGYKLDVSGTGRFTSTVTATNFILSSDKTLKDNISDINTDHVDVKWKNFELKSEPGVKRAGVVAQELEEKHPEFVRTDKDGMKSVAYIDLLIAKIAELEARLEKLEK